MKATQKYTEHPAPAIVAEPNYDRAIGTGREDLHICRCLWGVFISDIERYLPERLHAYVPAILEALAQVMTQGVDDGPGQYRILHQHMKRLHRLLRETEGHA